MFPLSGITPKKAGAALSPMTVYSILSWNNQHFMQIKYMYLESLDQPKLALYTYIYIIIYGSNISQQNFTSAYSQILINSFCAEDDSAIWGVFCGCREIWGADKLRSKSVFDNVDNNSSIGCALRSSLVTNLNLELLEKKKMIIFLLNHIVYV